MPPDPNPSSLEARFRPERRLRLPGPASATLLKRQQEVESAAVSYPRRLPIAIGRAAGSYVEDLDGNVFIDFLTGAGVLSLGHNHPDVIRAAQDQMGLLCQGLDFPSQAKERFTAAQLSMFPREMRNDLKVHFCGPTGADAVEAAVKLAKLHTGGDEVISFSGSYHGCGHAGLSLSSGRAMKSGIGNRLPGVHFFPFSHCGDCPLGLTRDRCDTNCALYLEHALLDSHSGLGRPACAILELVQGEGGVCIADPDFVRRVRDVTAKLEIPLIVDEIQTGCGRTGAWFSFEHYGITPDVVLASKALSGMGAPVSTIFYRRAMDVWDTGRHIGTFRGNQVAFAAGAEAIEVFKREDVLANVRERGEQARVALERMREDCPIVGQVRGIGLMLGLEVRDPELGAPSTELARRVQRGALERGLILEVGGRGDTVVRMLPPLNVTERTMALALEATRAALVAAESDWRAGRRESAECD